jgi:hypothetical protein
MMKKPSRLSIRLFQLFLMPAMLVASIAGCGGGSGDGSGGASVPLLAVPSASGQELVIVSAQRNSITVSNGDFLVRFGGANNISISGNGNQVIFAANENGGLISISGEGNTVIFRPGTTATNLTVSGRNNTVYIAEGSGITVSGPQGSGSTVRTYPV